MVCIKWHLSLLQRIVPTPIKCGSGPRWEQQQNHLLSSTIKATFPCFHCMLLPLLASETLYIWRYPLMFLSVSVAQPRTQCQAYVEPLRVLKSKANWKRYSILETVFTVSILWAWQESDWASYWFVQYCFSFNSPAFKQHTELSQETPCLGVHLHTAHPVHLLVATSLSFPALSVWTPLQGKAVFLCNPQFNTLTWHQHFAAVFPVNKVLSLPFMPLCLK